MPLPSASPNLTYWAEMREKFFTNGFSIPIKEICGEAGITVLSIINSEGLYFFLLFVR